MFNVWQWCIVCVCALILYLWCKKLQSITKSREKTEKWRIMAKKIVFYFGNLTGNKNDNKNWRIMCSNEKPIDVYKRGRNSDCHSVYQLSLEQINIWSTLLSLIFDVLPVGHEFFMHAKFEWMKLVESIRTNRQKRLWQPANDWPNIPIACKLNALCGTLFCVRAYRW